MRRNLFSVFTQVAVIVFFSLTSPFLQAHDGVRHQSSDHSQEINSAMHWLESSQGENGLIATPSEVSTDFQATAEALVASKLLGSTSIDTTSAVEQLGDSPENLTTEYLARLLVALADLGESPVDIIQALISRQGEDGGFGDFRGYDSTPLDTAHALIALQHAGQDTSVAARAVGYLSSTQLVTGGFGHYGQQSSPMVTALVVRALRPYVYTFNISAVLGSAVDFLYVVQDSEGLWRSDWESALVLKALIPVTTNVSLYEKSINSILANQSPDGSWESQVYSTALSISALNSLANIEVPVDPEKALIRGRLTDAMGGVSIPSASIDVSGVNTESVVIERDGQFVISNLEAGSYIVIYSAPGYLSASQSLVLKKGQFADVGTISLSVAPSAALISGVLTDSSTGEPIAGATITVTVNGRSVSAITNENGEYQLLSELGEATLTVASESHYEVNANVELAAGSSVSFSPVLLLSSEEQPDNSAIYGSIADEANQALPGVEVSLLGSDKAVITDANGKFTIADAPPEDVAIQIFKSGYQRLHASLIIPERTNVNIGVITLKEQQILPSTTLVGQVLDLGTGAPVAGAAVQAGSLSVTTDNNGFYRLADISVLEFTVSVNASGYLFTNKEISLTEHTDLALNINIRKADLGGVEITSLASDATVYGAYDPVIITATLYNDTALTQSARLYVRVRDSDGVEVARFPGSYLPPLDSTLDEEELAHYQQHLAETLEELTPGEQRSVQLEQWWNTQHYPPGSYVVTVQAIDGVTSNLISENSIVVFVEETARLEDLKVLASPGYVLLNNQADVTIESQVLNRSNVPIIVQFNYALVDPSGQMLMDGQGRLELDPGQDSDVRELTIFPYLFPSSGDYPIIISDVSGANVDDAKGGSIFVPPSIRLDIDQFLTPSEVVPLEGVSVKSNIQVKGVDGE